MVTIELFRELTNQCATWLQTEDIYWDSTGVSPDEFSRDWNMIPLSNIDILRECERWNTSLAGTTTSRNYLGKCIEDIKQICKDNNLQVPNFLLKLNELN